MSNFYIRLDDLEAVLEGICIKYGIRPENDKTAALFITQIGKLPIMLAEKEIHAKWNFVEREDFCFSDAALWLGVDIKNIKEMPVCSNCKTEFGQIVLDYKRCPECGAHMDLEVIEEQCKNYPHR